MPGSVARRAAPSSPDPAAVSEETCPEQLRGRTPAATAPSEPPHSPTTLPPHRRPEPAAAPPAPHLRWSKEWMLREAFPCPPPTQLRERPNMLAAEGCSGPRALRPHSPAGRASGGRRRARNLRGGTGPHGACAARARRKAPAQPRPRGLRVPGSTAGGGAKPSHGRGGAGRGGSLTTTQE